MPVGCPRESVQGTSMNLGVPWEVHPMHGASLWAVPTLWELVSPRGVWAQREAKARPEQQHHSERAFEEDGDRGLGICT